MTAFDSLRAFRTFACRHGSPFAETPPMIWIAQASKASA